jgi:hypothetical protein
VSKGPRACGLSWPRVRAGQLYGPIGRTSRYPAKHRAAQIALACPAAGLGAVSARAAAGPACMYECFRSFRPIATGVDVAWHRGRPRRRRRRPTGARGADCDRSLMPSARKRGTPLAGQQRLSASCTGSGGMRSRPGDPARAVALQRRNSLFDVPSNCPNSRSHFTL